MLILLTVHKLRIPENNDVTFDRKDSWRWTSYNLTNTLKQVVKNNGQEMQWRYFQKGL